MAIYRIKRYSSDNESHTGRNLLLGTGAAVGAFALGRRGYLGNSMLRWTNKAWTRAGNLVGSESMMKSGSEGVAKARANTQWEEALGNHLQTEGATAETFKGLGGFKTLEDYVANQVKSTANNYMNDVKKAGTWTRTTGTEAVGATTPTA